MKPHDLITAISTDPRELQSSGDLNRQAVYGTNKPRTRSALVIQLIFPSTTHSPPVPTWLVGTPCLSSNAHSYKLLVISLAHTTIVAWCVQKVIFSGRKRREILYGVFSIIWYKECLTILFVLLDYVWYEMGISLLKNFRICRLEIFTFPMEIYKTATSISCLGCIIKRSDGPNSWI